MSVNCLSGITLGYNGTLGTWNFAGVEGFNMFLTSYDYLGYHGGANVVFPGGLEVSNGQNSYGQERMIDSGAAADTRPTAIRGNVRFNNNPNSGGAMAWAETVIATSSLGANVVAGTTTSVAVSPCPSPAPAVGDLVTDEVPVNGVLYTNVLLGTFASCSAGTLTFQAAASNNGSNGDEIFFLEARAAAPISNDAGGYTWPVGRPADVASLLASLPCDGSHIGTGVVSNGQAAGTAGYNAAVTSTTGSATRLVFCDGTSWTYH